MTVARMCSTRWIDRRLLRRCVFLHWKARRSRRLFDAAELAQPRFDRKAAALVLFGQHLDRLAGIEGAAQPGIFFLRPGPSRVGEPGLVLRCARFAARGAAERLHSYEQ